MIILNFGSSILVIVEEKKYVYTFINKCYTESSTALSFQVCNSSGVNSIELVRRD